MAFPWDNLISAAAGVIGGLGGAGITGHLTNRREEAAAGRAAGTARADRHRDAYAALLMTSRAALRNFRQLTLAYAANTPDIQEVQDAISAAGDIAGSLNEAAAVAELLGSARVREQARNIYEKARACSMVYQLHSVLEARPRTMAGWLPPQDFDAKKAAQRCEELAAAIDEFADVARDEIAENT